MFSKFKRMSVKLPTIEEVRKNIPDWKKFRDDLNEIFQKIELEELYINSIKNILTQYNFYSEAVKVSADKIKIYRDHIEYVFIENGYIRFEIDTKDGKIIPGKCIF